MEAIRNNYKRATGKTYRIVPVLDVNGQVRPVLETIMPEVLAGRQQMTARHRATAQLPPVPTHVPQTVAAKPVPLLSLPFEPPPIVTSTRANRPSSRVDRPQPASDHGQIPRSRSSSTIRRERSRSRSRDPHYGRERERRATRDQITTTSTRVGRHRTPRRPSPHSRELS